jgi:hypothetical protein
MRAGDERRGSDQRGAERAGGWGDVLLAGAGVRGYGMHGVSRCERRGGVVVHSDDNTRGVQQSVAGKRRDRPAIERDAELDACQWGASLSLLRGNSAWVHADDKRRLGDQRGAERFNGGDDVSLASAGLRRCVVHGIYRCSGRALDVHSDDGDGL